MAAGELLAVGETVNGLEGRVIVTVNGERITVAEARNITLSVAITKDSRKSLGRRSALSKATGYEGTGTMTIFYGSRLFVDMMLKYMNQGIETFFTTECINDDPSSDRLRQSIIASNCSIDSIDIAMLDAEETFLEQEVPFTFETAVRV